MQAYQTPDYHDQMPDYRKPTNQTFANCKENRLDQANIRRKKPTFQSLDSSLAIEYNSIDRIAP
jgi:hypothetical protein